ncbi:3420_t:CDS:2 [Cetraspora pellucida]|uniref:3420_t:CDS:1 n=1 Tax=Cetraspora pellucida TaxID=1433469 RepID=A0ACA9MG49_9GLOM|nr:3420_t:CDS:2 [Cetraspora pellucida]
MTLDGFLDDCLVFFLMATYGEGKHTEFWELINSVNPVFSKEENFLGWKEDMWKAVCDVINIDPNDAQNRGIRMLLTRLSIWNITVFYGELSEHALNGGTRIYYDAKNPFPSAITASRELFNKADRNCVHM